MIGLLIVATSPQYRQYAKDLIASAKIYFPVHEAVVFTDAPQEFEQVPNVIAIQWPHMGFPQATLKRYHAYVREKQLLRRYDYLFAIDSDMLVVASITASDILADGVTATLHPGYTGRTEMAELETRGESTAYCDKVNQYYCGGFLGGARDAFLRMAETIKENIDKDESKGIIARWHDESQINKYLYDNPPAKILDPSYCSPQGNPVGSPGFYQHIWIKAGYEIKTKILAVAKRGYE